MISVVRYFSLPPMAASKQRTITGFDGVFVCVCVPSYLVPELQRQIRTEEEEDDDDVERRQITLDIEVGRCV